MTRIISGKAGSVRLDVPKAGTRPTSDRVREAVFSSLSSWDLLEGMRVLDLYAGSGALGLEAASRGASEVALIERHPPAARITESNATRVRAAIGKDTSIRVHTASVAHYLNSAVGPWDVIFSDPPYDLSEQALAEDLQEVLRLLSPEGVVVVERSGRSPEPNWPAGLSRFREKKYGETTLWWAELDSDDAEETPG
ncbi:16S rRNA (guanine(966)-N(2))-methyltransferase RsmD [Leucobacter sp. M11]|uniref:16S rRNA (guanine(966)-N(2))-methyltransferase RsmD n=1 Tax=Leucobacter sp. M11 TaxID=2993565 RepID=UPI002D80DF6D|nr:16S rRNA (guanine(966)-N(2))-methyltransferase RsmD [Leucobacter sp. M11]MEB4613281.1 16S rRNA (guanine(966)-N(2))-methyltransferase RsmD [Leucobacter sp. M11]